MHLCIHSSIPFPGTHVNLSDGTGRANTIGLKTPPLVFWAFTNVLCCGLNIYAGSNAVYIPCAPAFGLAKSTWHSIFWVFGAFWALATILAEITFKAGYAQLDPSSEP